MPSVDVIIAAWDAQATVNRAIQSALGQPEVKKVIVINDGSTDGTEKVVQAASAADHRVVLYSTDVNKGPAVARNIGISQSDAGYIALLDADDFFLPARFSKIFAVEGWDVIADNIAFVPEDQADQFVCSKLKIFTPEACHLSLDAFVAGNISKAGKQRGELGFIKPVIRRDFIDAHSIRYDESLRLGEDYAFYLNMLFAGASFQILKSCGYVAIERANSLSGNHRTADLAALLKFSREVEKSFPRNIAEQLVFKQHRTQLEAKLFHREILDTRRGKGRLAALVQALTKPTALPKLANAILCDKFARPQAPDREVRYLL